MSRNLGITETSYIVQQHYDYVPQVSQAHSYGLLPHHTICDMEVFRRIAAIDRLSGRCQNPVFASMQNLSTYNTKKRKSGH